MTRYLVNKNRLKKLDFYFIDEIHRGIYKKIYAKSIWEKGTKVDVFDDRITFWTKDNPDHRIVINFKYILCTKINKGEYNK